MEVEMSNCCGCRQRGISYGWLAFWGLVLYLIFSTPHAVGQSPLAEDAASELSDLCQSYGGNVAKPMSTSRTPSYEEDQAIQRLFSEMEEQGRRLPKI